MRKILLSLIGISLYIASAAQCSMIEVPLAQRASSSSLVVEGKVIAQNSFWNTNNTMIYTSNTIEVYKIFKGNPTVTSIIIITEGGIVGMNKITAEPALGFNINDVGVFTCMPVTRAKFLPSTRSSVPIYEAYAAVQGFVKYNLADETASDVFRTYHNIETEVYPVVSASNNGRYTIVKPFSVSGNTNRNGNPNIQSVSITSFSPTTITAGTGTVLTINGSGFGASQGSGTVGFKNADDGGATYINPLQTQIVTWTNTQITVRVPSNAGTGTIQVTQGTTGTSAGTLTVSWAHLNVDFDPGSGTEAYQTDHIDDNGLGGYTWQMNANVDGNVLERAAFMRAFDSWRCTTGINWTIGANTSVNDAVSDGTNCICNDNANPLPAGVLGVCYSYWSGCASGPTIVWYVNELDIIFDEGSNISPLTWDYGPGTPTGSQYDFESVCVHELGHGHQLGHVINNGQIMHYALTNGTFNRTLSANDIAAGNFVQAKSIVANVCGPGAMTNHTCGSAPVAAFSGTPTTICAGGTVNFTDQSTNTPTSWSWTFQGGTPPTSTSQNPSVIYNVAGSYSVSLTATNATGSDLHSVTGYITVRPNPTATGSITSVSCNGGNTGAIDLTPAGGTAPYTFLWNPSGQTTEDRTSLTAATYSVTVTDTHGCTSLTSYIVTQPTALVVTPSTQTNVSCNGNSNGAASVIASGGTTAYSYNWTPGNPTGDGTASVTGLAAGSYTCTVTDAHGCTNTATFNITQPTAVVVTPASQTNISCNGGNNGAASVSASGGAGGYTYNWTPGNPTGDGTSSVTGLTTGSWTCTVTDANSCVQTQTFNITQPSAISLTAASQTNLSCNGGSNGAASVNVATGGAGGYTYNWTPGNPTGDGTVSVTGLTAGSWTCTVTDANSCTQAHTFTITQPTAISISMSETDESCAGGDGTATATPSGGTSPYTYLWTPGGQTAQMATNLSPASYTCTVTDGNGCSNNASVVVGTNCAGSAPNAIFEPAGTGVICDGSGTIQLFDLSTSNPTSWLWSFPGGTPSSSTQQNPFVSYASPGSYDVTLVATNASGSGSQTMIGVITVNPALNASPVVTNVSCHGGNNGAIALNLAGGTTPYSISWSPSGQTTQTISSLTAATYSATITDARGCTTIALTSYTITQPSAIGISMSGTNASCPNNDGTTTAGASGGTSPYTYSWAPGGQTTATATALSAGTYTCTVTDANGCSNSGTVTITAATCAGTTHLTAASCGITLTTLNQNINCVAVSGATNYQYKFMQGASTITTFTRGNSLTNCDLSVIPVLQYAQTYQVLVRAYVGNAWGSFGSSCNVTTPAFPAGHVSVASCGSTLANMTDAVNCNSIIGATNYQWKFMQGATLIATYTRGTNLTDCILSNVVGVSFGQTYDVYVRAYEGGMWGPYGTSCTITTPSSFPTTQVSATWCNGTVTNLSSGLSCDPVAGATNYQWKAVNGAFSSVANRGSNQTNWRMSWNPGTTVNTTYTVTVRAFVGGVWGAFGPACTVSIGPNMIPLYPGDGVVPSEVRLANPDINYPADEFTMDVYPNPFSENLTVIIDADVQSLSIYNSFGELVRNVEIKDGTAELHLGDLANGIYLIQAQTSTSVVRKRIIKQ